MASDGTMTKRRKTAEEPPSMAAAIRDLFGGQPKARLTDPQLVAALAKQLARQGVEVKPYHADVGRLRRLWNKGHFTFGKPPARPLRRYGPDGRPMKSGERYAAKKGTPKPAPRKRREKVAVPEEIVVEAEVVDAAGETQAEGSEA